MKTIVKETKNKGKGVYALKDIKKGETILYLDGEIWEKENNKEYNEDTDPNGGPIGRRNNYIQYLKSESDWVYINHSCDANSGLINDKKLIARKNIKEGEEITQDYSAIDIEGIKGGKKELGMKCQCVSNNCRRIIVSYDKLDEKTKKELRPYVNSVLIKLYNLK